MGNGRACGRWTFLPALHKVRAASQELSVVVLALVWEGQHGGAKMGPGWGLCLLWAQPSQPSHCYNPGLPWQLLPSQQSFMGAQSPGLQQRSRTCSCTVSCRLRVVHQSSVVCWQGPLSAESPPFEALVLSHLRTSRLTLHEAASSVSNHLAA